MRFTVEESVREVAGRPHPVVALAGAGSRAEVWPGLGGNCVSWQVGGRELLYSPPLEQLADRPTRGGIPVLFPFPNRIRDGRFFWNGRVYQLPRNDPAQKNAIHGFTPRNPWRVTDHGEDGASAWLRAEFQISRDAPDVGDLWPTDGRLTLTITLTRNALQYTAVVEAPGRGPLPFGLGYHPYFAVTPDCRVQTPAQARWELVDTLPTGNRLPVSGAQDLRQPRLIADLSLDDVYTDFPDTPPDADGLIERGRVEYPDGGVLRVRTAPAFRDLVLFIPPHRQAVCLEPYTCPTDAIHLQEREDVGWQVLPPGGRWEGIVVYAWNDG